MGIYDQLADLDKTPPVAPPKPRKTVETAPAEETPSPPSVKPVKRRQPVSPPPPVLPVVVEPHRTKQRLITRNSFEIYQDQIEVLRHVSLTAKLAGDKLSISEMVREALDSYLTDKNLKL